MFNNIGGGAIASLRTLRYNNMGLLHNQKLISLSFFLYFVCQHLSFTISDCICSSFPIITLSASHLFSHSEALPDIATQDSNGNQITAVSELPMDVIQLLLLSPLFLRLTLPEDLSPF